MAPLPQEHPERLFALRLGRSHDEHPVGAPREDARVGGAGGQTREAAAREVASSRPNVLQTAPSSRTTTYPRGGSITSWAKPAGNSRRVTSKGPATARVLRLPSDSASIRATLTIRSDASAAASLGRRASPAPVRRRRDTVGAERRAIPPRPVPRPVDEDAAARRPRAAAESLPPVGPDRLEQRRGRRRAQHVQERPDVPEPPPTDRRARAAVRLRSRRGSGSGTRLPSPRPPPRKPRAAGRAERAPRRARVRRPRCLLLEPAAREEATEDLDVTQLLGLGLELVPRVDHVDRQLDRIVGALEHVSMVANSSGVKSS